MRTYPWWTMLMVAAAVSLSSLTGCGKRASEEIDFGSIKNSVYENQYLGFKVALPQTWSVQDQEAQRQLMALGKGLVAGDDRDLNAMLKASEMQTVNLFAIFKHPRGAAVAFNPAIMAVAESVRQLPGIQRGKDYLFHARRLLESGQMHISFPREVYTEQLGGIDFDVMDLEFSVGGSVVKEKYYTTIKKGYALGFIEIYVTEEEESFERAVLGSIQFK
jgi:hypothetical protein